MNPPIASGAFVLVLAVSGTTAWSDCLRYAIQYFEAACSPGGTDAMALNSAAALGGHTTCSLPGTQHACTWIDGVLNVLPKPPGLTDSNVGDISDGGVVVGWAWVESGPETAFRFSDDVLTILPKLPDASTSSAESITSGAPEYIAGKSKSKAVLWIDGEILALELPIGPNSGALDVNEQGVACGWMGNGQHAGTGFVWEKGRATIIPKPRGAIGIEVHAINDAGIACGYYRMPVESGFQPRIPFAWDGKKVADLPFPDGYERGYAFDINNAGDIVGYCDWPQVKACIWRNGVPTVIDYLLADPPSSFTVKIARAINDTGQIAAEGVIESESAYLAVLLTPIPPLQGDLTCDWLVDGADLGILLGAWGDCVSPSPPGRGVRGEGAGKDPIPADCPADLNPDGTVDGADLGLLLADWTG